MSEVGLDIENKAPGSEFKVTLDDLGKKIETALQKHSNPKSTFKLSAEAGTQDVQWEREGFSVTESIKQLSGPLIEIAGPTEEGYDLVDFSKLGNDKKLFISNLSPGCPLYDQMTGEFLGYAGKLDFQADATKMPIKNEGCGALFASCVPTQIREKTLAEAHRVLQEGGLFVWQGALDNDIEIAKKSGFEVMKYSRHVFNDYGMHNVNVILRKQRRMPNQPD